MFNITMDQLIDHARIEEWICQSLDYLKATEILNFLKGLVSHAIYMPQCLEPEATLQSVHRTNQPIQDLLTRHLVQHDRYFGLTHRMAPDILDIAYDVQHRSSTDPGDKIYGLAGIVRLKIVAKT